MPQEISPVLRRATRTIALAFLRGFTAGVASFLLFSPEGAAGTVNVSFSVLGGFAIGATSTRLSSPGDVTVDATGSTGAVSPEDVDEAAASTGPPAPEG
ncbi:MAG: hypothetical protein ACRERD_27575, partial [Candidatus Binatia bacterium]